MYRYIIIALFITGCSLEYDSSVAESLDESIPTSRLYDVKRVQVQEGQPKVTFDAREAVVWEDKEETELYDFIFNEFDRERSVITTGEADYLLITDSHDARIEGDVYGYSLRNEASVTAESLNWADEQRELSSAEDTTVRIEMDNGSVLEGRGFKADLYTNTTSFSSGIGGVLESGESGEPVEPAEDAVREAVDDN